MFVTLVVLLPGTSWSEEGTLSDTELAAENIGELRWWPVRDLATPLLALATGGVPAEPVRLVL